MSDKTLTVWVGASIIYLYGTVNGTAATFTLAGDGYWQAAVPRTEDDNYLLHLEAYSANGLEGTYDYTLFYGMMPSVTDRTAADVARVEYLTKKGWAAMTAAEKAEWLEGMKGAYNYTDLNRVGHNVDYLAGLLNGYGYTVIVSPEMEWEQGDIPDITQMTQYIADLSSLKDAFYGTQVIPASIDNLLYIDANNIELLLEEIYTYIIRMIDGFRKCGTYKAGQGVILP